MVLDFSVEAAKLREQARRKQAAAISSFNRSDLIVEGRIAVDPAPFGSGWYHDAAVLEAERGHPRKV